MAALGAIAPIMSIGSGVLGAMGAVQQGNAAKVAGEYQHYIDVQKGRQALAESQIPMINEYRKGDYLSSRLRANAAAGGGGVDTPTIKALYGDIASAAQTQADLELNKGKQQQWGWNIAGDNAEWMGDVQKRASNWNALGSLLGGVARVPTGSWGDIGKTFNSVFG